MENRNSATVLQERGVRHTLTMPGVGTCLCSNVYGNIINGDKLYTNLQFPTTAHNSNTEKHGLFVGIATEDCDFTSNVNLLSDNYGYVYTDVAFKVPAIVTETSNTETVTETTDTSTN
jgi:hypothetical protein